MDSEQEKHKTSNTIKTTEELQKQAEDMIRHFETTTSEEIWQKGFRTATQWLALINAEEVNLADVMAIIGIVHANWGRSIMWYEFAKAVYAWALSKGASLPPYDEFFTPNRLGNENLSKIVKAGSLEHPEEYAKKLYDIFNQNADEDPTSEVWQAGLKIINEWMRLIGNKRNAENEVLALLKSTSQNYEKYPGTHQWFETLVVIQYWCKPR